MDLGITDDHPEGDPAGIHHDDIMREISARKIYYWFGFIRKERTDRMINAFNRSLLQHSARLLSIKQFDISNPDVLQAAVHDVLVGSIGATVADSRQIEKIVPYRIDARDPSFRYLQTHHVKKTPNTERLSDGEFLIRPPREPVSLKTAVDPFATGNIRLAYHAYSETHNKRMVLKRFKRSEMSRNSYRSYVEYVEVQRIAMYQAETFNQQKPRQALPIHFVTVDVIDFKGTSPETLPTPWSRWYTMEEFVSGRYKKYNNNTGYASPSEDDTNLAMQAFSHYTWVTTSKKLVVCDLQGLTNAIGTFLIDPVIHSKEYWKFGKTNLGPKGIRRFFQSHICNRICKEMGLETYPL